MNPYISKVLFLAVALIGGVWLDHSLPHYGLPLGTAITTAYLLGVATKGL